MFVQPSWRLLVAAALSLGTCVLASAQTLPEPTDIFYVNPDANNPWPGGNGRSWADAFVNLVDALAEIPGIVDMETVIVRINVAGGTYQGASFFVGNSIYHIGAFAVPDRMLIYGGYKGQGSDPDDRDLEAWKTTLSGVLPLGSTAPAVCGSLTAGDCFTDNGTEPGCDDIDCCAAVCLKFPWCCTDGWSSLCAVQAAFTCVDLAPYEVRADSVVVAVGAGTMRRLDGLTITGGGQRPSPPGSAGFDGGGVLVTTQDLSNDAGLAIVRCRIVDNMATSGGGVAVVGDVEVDCDGFGAEARALIWNCEIVENASVEWGGGFFARYQASYEIVNTVIARNRHVIATTETEFSNGARGAGVADLTSAIPNLHRRIVNSTITRNEGVSPASR